MNWHQIANYIGDRPYYEEIQLNKRQIPHPSLSGFNKSQGELRGQLADWRETIQDGASLHVVEFDTEYMVHKDKINPDKDPIGHLMKDAPHWLVILSVLAIIGIGAGIYYLSKSKEDGSDIF